MRLFVAVHVLAFWIWVRTVLMLAEDFAYRRSRRADERVRQALLRSGGAL